MFYTTALLNFVTITVRYFDWNIASVDMHTHFVWTKRKKEND